MTTLLPSGVPESEVPEVDLGYPPPEDPRRRGRSRPPRPPKPPLEPAGRRPLFLLSSVVTIVSVLCVTFVASVSVIGTVKHARDQKTAYATLRGTLANATAPVTQLGEDGKLVPLGTPIGVLDIPQISLREVLIEGTSAGVPRSGPGHRRDSPMPGQAGTSFVLGRQAAYGGPFANIGQLRPGHVFTITTGQGQQVFRVVAIRKAGDLQPPAVVAGKGRVTLVTAAGRPWVPEGLLRVDADLVSQVQPAGARPLTITSLPEPEKPLSGNPAAWIWILLLTQALLLGALAVTWARYRWGRWQIWLSGGPPLLALGVALSDQVAMLLPNLM